MYLPPYRNGVVRTFHRYFVILNSPFYMCGFGSFGLLVYHCVFFTV